MLTYANCFQKSIPQTALTLFAPQIEHQNETVENAIRRKQRVIARFSLTRTEFSK